MSCGMCAVSLKDADPSVKVRMAFDEERDSFVPKVEGWNPDTKPGTFVCPGEEMNLPQLSEQVYKKQPEDPLLGVVENLRVVHSTNEDFHKNSASGGVIPATLSYLFRTKQIDIAYCVQPGSHLKDAGGRVIRSEKEIHQIHGSVYHPINFGLRLETLLKGDERFAFVGLPCQVAGLEMLKKSKPELVDRHVISLGLFCGGINTFKGIAYYAHFFKVSWEKVKQVAYRVGPWPGKMKIDFKDGSESKLLPRIRGNSRWKILRYVIAFQGYWMLKRCRLCPDQVSDFADIAVGDPHSQKYRSRGGAGFSIAVTRTPLGERIMKEMLEKGEFAGNEETRDFVVESQGYTLDNRRHVRAYTKIAQAFGGEVPKLIPYPQNEQLSFRHFVYGAVDMMKVALPKSRLTRAFYLPWQIFEYLFITFTPSLIMKRFFKIVFNK